MPEPYSACKYPESLSNSFIIKELKKKGKSYEKETCIEMCKSILIIEKCKCVHIDYSKLYDIKPRFCETRQDFTCIEELYTKELFSFETCNRECPDSCEWIDYDINILYEDFPNSMIQFHNLKNMPGIKQHFPDNHNISFEDLKSSLVCLNIYYDDLKYTSISENPSKTPIDLLADIGKILYFLKDPKSLFLEILLILLFLQIEKKIIYCYL